MKKLITILLISFALFSCNDHDDHTSGCTKGQNKSEFILYNHDWELTYWHDSLNFRLSFAPVFNDTIPNIIKWHSDGTGDEYSYLDYTNPFQSGTFIVNNCGTGVFITTPALQGVQLTLKSIDKHNFKGTIPPIGAFPFKVRIEGKRI